MSLPPFLAHMGGLPNRIDSAKINGITRTVDTSPVYGQRRAYTGTIDREISESVQSYRDQAKQRRIAAAIARQTRTNRK
jgi:hypothetical protein